MELLIACLVVLVVVALLIYCVDLLPLPAPFNNAIKVILILIAVLWIVQRSGVLR